MRFLLRPPSYLISLLLPFLSVSWTRTISISLAGCLFQISGHSPLCNVTLFRSELFGAICNYDLEELGNQSLGRARDTITGVLIRKRHTQEGQGKIGDRTGTEWGQSRVVLPPGTRQGLGPLEETRQPSSTELHSLAG